MSTSEINKFRQLLKDSGHQVTKAREATFRLLLHPEPQSLNQIIAQAAGSVDRVSIYRNIDLFEKLGIVHRIYVGWKYKIELSDEFTAHHHHLSCLNCGAMIDIGDEKHLDDFIARIAAEYNFAPRRHQFEIDGYCAECRSAID